MDSDYKPSLTSQFMTWPANEQARDAKTVQARLTSQQCPRETIQEGRDDLSERHGDSAPRYVFCLLGGGHPEAADDSDFWGL